MSLSRPLYVRKDQRSALEAALRDAVGHTAPFELSFSALRVLRNDEQTRVFLGVDVAAGYPEVRALPAAAPSRAVHALGADVALAPTCASTPNRSPP